MLYPATAYAEVRCDFCRSLNRVPMAEIAEPFACAVCGNWDALSPAGVEQVHADFARALTAALAEQERLGGASVRAEAWRAGTVVTGKPLAP